MGTRGTVTVKEDGRTVLRMYVQFDSYLSGLGKDLKEKFGSTRIVNGYGSDMRQGYANGMGCLAGQIVSALKGGIGGYYLTASKERQEFNYTLSEATNGQVLVRVTDCDGKKIYNGPLSALPTED